MFKRVRAERGDEQGVGGGGTVLKNIIVYFMFSLLQFRLT